MQFRNTQAKQNRSEQLIETLESQLGCIDSFSMPAFSFSGSQGCLSWSPGRQEKHTSGRLPVCCRLTHKQANRFTPRGDSESSPRLTLIWRTCQVQINRGWNLNLAVSWHHYQLSQRARADIIPSFATTQVRLPVAGIIEHRKRSLRWLVHLGVHLGGFTQKFKSPWNSSS